MLNKANFNLDKLDEKMSRNLGPYEHTQRAFSKLDNTHLAKLDNKIVRRMQPIVDRFTKINFGQFKVATIKNMMFLGAKRLYVVTNQNITNSNLEWSVTVDKFSRCNCLDFVEMFYTNIRKKMSTSFASSKTMSS